MGFVWKEKNIGRESDGRRLDECGIGTGVSGALCEPSWVGGDLLTRLLANGRETCWTGVPLGRSSIAGPLSGWCGAEAITSEELGVILIGYNIPVMCFVKVAIAR